MHAHYDVDASFSANLLLDAASPTYKRDLDKAIEVALQDTRPELSKQESDEEVKRF